MHAAHSSLSRLLAATALAGVLAGVRGDDSINTNTVVSIISVALVLGTWFFWYAGVAGERSYFLVLGCFCCALGNAIFGVMIVEEQGNPTWGAGFACLTLAALHGLYVQFQRYRREGVFSDSDSDDEEGESAPAPAAAPARSRLLKPEEAARVEREAATAAGVGSAGAGGAGRKKRKPKVA